MVFHNKSSVVIDLNVLAKRSVSIRAREAREGSYSSEVIHSILNYTSVPFYTVLDFGNSIYVNNSYTISRS